MVDHHEEKAQKYPTAFQANIELLRKKDEKILELEREISELKWSPESMVVREWWLPKYFSLGTVLVWFNTIKYVTLWDWENCTENEWHHYKYVWIYHTIWRKEYKFEIENSYGESGGCIMKISTKKKKLIETHLNNIWECKSFVLWFIIGMEQKYY